MSERTLDIVWAIGILTLLSFQLWMLVAVLAGIHAVAILAATAMTTRA